VPSLCDELVDGFVKELAGLGDDPDIKRYQKDPIEYMVERLGIKRDTLIWSEHPAYANHKWDGDIDPLAKVMRELALWHDVGVESGTGTGKTYVLGAGLTLWFLECWENSIVVTLAPKADQLKLHLWKEVGSFWPAFKERHTMANLTTLSLKMRGTESWAATGFPVQVRAGEPTATKAAGFHAEHMMIITEETPGIDHAIMATVENTCTAPHNLRLALGNPDNQADALHKFCTQEGVTHVRISALDHPNVVRDDPMVVPGAVSREKIVVRAERYGKENRLYRSRVRGVCPTESADALIRWSWCVEASNRTLDEIEEAYRYGPPALGVDVANSEAGDEAAIAKGIGPRLMEVTTRPCPDSNLLGKSVNSIMNADGIDERNVGVDAIGIGAGTVNELKRLGKHVHAIQSAAKQKRRSNEQESFLNLRARMHWALREALQHGRIILPYDEELFQELTEITTEDRNGQITVESKKDLKIRLKHSPNKADAVVYWNWCRVKRQRATGLVTMIDL
jgi:hypothetical protein